MKKLSIWLAAAALILSGCSEDRSQILKVYNWSDYIDESVIPELRPGMISGFILAYTMSLDDFAVTFFTRGTIGLETLSTYIYTDARKGGLTPELRPLMTLIFIVILVLLVIINVRKERQMKKLNSVK